MGLVGGSLDKVQGGSTGACDFKGNVLPLIVVLQFLCASRGNKETRGVYLEFQ
jgi:hypothetical protein